MYRVAVCEDELHMRTQLCDLCHQILTRMSEAHEIVPFLCAEALDEALIAGDKPFDLLLLDIKLGEMTGLELARALREREDRTSIIFVTSCMEFLINGYEVQPIQFLLKPVKREALAAALATDLKINHTPNMLSFQTKGDSCTLPIRELLAVESADHSILLHTVQGTRPFPIPLSQAERMLPPGQFCRCHRCYIINMAHVDTIGRGELTLEGGQRVPVGRKYAQDIQTHLVRYVNQS